MINQSEELASIYLQIKSRIDGEIRGITSGFERLDYMVGRLNPGNLIIVGGYTGAGKSAFLINMIDSFMHKEENRRVAIFSAELTKEAYIARQIFLQAGIYRLDFERNPEAFKGKVTKSFGEYKDFLALNSNELDIFGSSRTFEDIQSAIRNGNYDIVFIDYIQLLTILEFIKTSETMEFLAKAFQRLALETGTVIVVASQINQSSFEESPDKAVKHPFHYGKELSDASHVALLLDRLKFKGERSPILDCHILKARDGETGIIPFLINPGFKLSEITRGEAFKKVNEWKMDVERRISE